MKEPESEAAASLIDKHGTLTLAEPALSPSEAEEILQDLAAVFTHHLNPPTARRVVYPPEQPGQPWSPDSQEDSQPDTATDSLPPDTPQFPTLEARYRALVEQIPAVVFMAYLDRGIGEAYVS